MKKWQKTVLVLVLVLASLLVLSLVLEMVSVIIMIAAPDSAVADFINGVMNHIINIFV